jgi:hypothetical protein
VVYQEIPLGRVQAACIADGHRQRPLHTAEDPAAVPQPQRRLEDRPPGVQQTLHPNGPAYFYYHPKTGLPGQCHTGPVLPEKCPVTSKTW